MMHTLQPATSIARYYLRTAMGWLVVLAGLGLLLRLALSGYVDIPYKHWLHGHSHIAFLGWVFNALIAGFYYSVQSTRSIKSHRTLFALVQLAVLGMAITFPMQGYGPFSIAFSTLHVALSAVLAVWTIQDVKVARRKQNELREGSRWWVLGVLWMLVSALGPFALGYFMANDMGDTSAYELSIYFYLHFQYNGWFFFGLMAVLLLWLGQSGRLDQSGSLPIARWLFGVTMIPAYALSAIWLDPAAWVWWAGGLAAFFQLLGLVFLSRSLRTLWMKVKSEWLSVVKLLFRVALVALGIKLLLQFLSIQPELQQLAFNRLTVIGYLHLVFLGMVTTALIAFFTQAGILRHSLLSQILLWMFLIAFIAMELFILWPVAFQDIPPVNALLWSTVLLSVSLGVFGLYQLIIPRRTEKANNKSK